MNEWMDACFLETKVGGGSDVFYNSSVNLIKGFLHFLPRLRLVK